VPKVYCNLQYFASALETEDNNLAKNSLDITTIGSRKLRNYTPRKPIFWPHLIKIKEILHTIKTQTKNKCNKETKNENSVKQLL